MTEIIRKNSLIKRVGKKIVILKVSSKKKKNNMENDALNAGSHVVNNIKWGYVFLVLCKRFHKVLM